MVLSLTVKAKQFILFMKNNRFPKHDTIEVILKV